ncbi:hypothetical protein Mvan_3111 [Mycolicibacterium vanbaalenii PYR-1]|uniref:Uncharacterized protein n=1 Tax=Mycolicibacterium vanbaalenii (strain DSM 7251 / JCM 13017 / BCRC 16820 / KCTC 9966 / NRRL B-24157 / PYR-1) TaxID=350058 RepID=A1T9R3_MYCVP|nr:hypothetical protein Mvan_3111 [Mycolicibacterium vanbaalenii PYR-1]
MTGEPLRFPLPAIGMRAAESPNMLLVNGFTPRIGRGWVGLTGVVDAVSRTSLLAATRGPRPPRAPRCPDRGPDAHRSHSPGRCARSRPARAFPSSKTPE